MVCLENLLYGKDVFAVFPTGYGKSILFQVLPDLFPQKSPGKDNIVLVICPLNSIIEDQLATLQAYNIKAEVLNFNLQSTCNKDLELFPDNEAGPEEQVDFCLPRNILNGELKILFCHPEALLSADGRDLLKSQEYQNRVVAWVVDEVHCVQFW